VPLAGLPAVSIRFAHPTVARAHSAHCSRPSRCDTIPSNAITPAIDPSQASGTYGPAMNPPTNRNIWELRAARQFFVLLCLLVALYLAYRIRAVLAPIGVAFLLSYAVDPAVAFLARRFRIPRAASAAFSLVIILAAISAFWAWAGPRLVDQTNALIDKLPEYANVLRERVGIDATELDAFVESLKEGESQGVTRAIQLGDLAMVGAQRMFGFVGTLAVGALYVIVAFSMIIVFFVLFVTYKGWWEHVERAIPQPHRTAIGKVAGYMDRALGAYVRGQLLVALFTFIGFSVGFLLADVPYWFVVALIGGTCSLVPYGQLLGPLLAITLKLLETQLGEAAFSWWGVLLAPLLVYAVTQSLESWVITPLVQGEVNRLHPAVVLTALILGGSIAGIAGLVLAIPVAATVKASMREFVFDRNDKRDTRASADGG
jgi:predicted PurR-regulated permease PerM